MPNVDGAVEKLWKERCIELMLHGTPLSKYVPVDPKKVIPTVVNTPDRWRTR